MLALLQSRDDLTENQKLIDLITGIDKRVLRIQIMIIFLCIMVFIPIILFLIVVIVSQLMALA